MEHYSSYMPSLPLWGSISLGMFNVLRVVYVATELKISIHDHEIKPYNTNQTVYIKCVYTQ